MQKMPGHRLPGNALIVTVIIALVLSILCGAFILLSYYSKQQQIVADSRQRLSGLFQSAVDLVLTDTLPLNGRIKEQEALGGSGDDQMEIRKESWGIYRVANIAVAAGRFKKSRNFYYGPALPPYMSGCIYLADHDRPLSVTGNTRLTGDAWLSKAGINAAYVNQQGYSNDELLNGQVNISEKLLPPLDSLYKLQLFDLTDSLLPAYIQGEYLGLPDSGSISRSFDEELAIIHSNNMLSLKNCRIEGHVLIKSDTCIEVERSAYLQHVILVAPVIRIKHSFAGNLQAIATDSLLVEDQVQLKYPSALVLLKDDSVVYQNHMIIRNDCLLQGSLLAVCKTDDLYKTYSEIGNNTRIEGVVYTMGYLALNGNVHGTVLTDYFLYKSSNMIYENHLMNVEINRRSLSPYFLTSLIFQKTTRQQIIGWLP